MTLRLRLTLFYTLLVALVLAASGLGLHLLLVRGLYLSLDESLQQAASLLSSFMEQDNGVVRLQPESEVAPPFSADLVAVVVGPGGRVLDSLGRLPAPLPKVRSGLSTQAGWRVWSEPVQGGTLQTLSSTSSIRESVRRFDLSFLILAPLAVLFAFGLGYIFSGQALRPVRQMTAAALELATRRAWGERLPEPANQDELWRLSQATNTLLAALAEVIESERRFTADAAHELRTPLTVLRGRLEQAAEKARRSTGKSAEGSTEKSGDEGEKRETSSVQAPLDAALNASDELLALVEKLLLLARADAGQGFRHETASLDEVAFEVSELLRPLFQQKGLSLRLDLPEEVQVEGDRVALGLLVRNLLENALKFTATGQVGIRVETRGPLACLQVWDSGPGIPQAALQHLFERFYQADVRHRQQGSGLGLALARSLAVWHGGTLSAHNRPEGGAVFTLELPALSKPGRPKTLERPALNAR